MLLLAVVTAFSFLLTIAGTQTCDDGIYEGAYPDCALLLGPSSPLSCAADFCQNCSNPNYAGQCRRSCHFCSPPEPEPEPEPEPQPEPEPEPEPGDADIFRPDSDGIFDINNVNHAVVELTITSGYVPHPSALQVVADTATILGCHPGRLLVPMVSATSAVLVIFASAARGAARGPSEYELLLQFVFEDYLQLPYASRATPPTYSYERFPADVAGCYAGEYISSRRAAEDVCSELMPLAIGEACQMRCTRALRRVIDDACFRGEHPNTTAAFNAKWSACSTAAFDDGFDAELRDFLTDVDLDNSGNLDWPELAPHLGISEPEFASLVRVRGKLYNDAVAMRSNASQNAAHDSATMSGSGGVQGIQRPPEPEPEPEPAGQSIQYVNTSPDAGSGPATEPTVQCDAVRGRGNGLLISDARLAALSNGRLVASPCCAVSCTQIKDTFPSAPSGEYWVVRPPHASISSFDGQSANPKEAWATAAPCVRTICRLDVEPFFSQDELRGMWPSFYMANVRALEIRDGYLPPRYSMPIRPSSSSLLLGDGSVIAGEGGGDGADRVWCLSATPLAVYELTIELGGAGPGPGSRTLGALVLEVRGRLWQLVEQFPVGPQALRGLLPHTSSQGPPGNGAHEASFRWSPPADGTYWLVARAPTAVEMNQTEPYGGSDVHGSFRLTVSIHSSTPSAAAAIAATSAATGASDCRGPGDIAGRRIVRVDGPAVLQLPPPKRGSVCKEGDEAHGFECASI